MAILDIFKKKDSLPVKPELTATEKAGKKEKKRKKQEKQPATDLSFSKKGEVSNTDCSKILLSPHVTEKAAILAEDDNKYIFKVYSGTNKIEIKKAVESLYNVKVVGVRIINIPSKQIRVGGKIGLKKGYKKAIVELMEGQKIEIISR
jgi:large subunit ribosomal protein L23